jgi:hypothetical protein
MDQPTAPDAVPLPAFDVLATSTGATGVLYGTNQSGRLYAIDPLTAAATLIGSGGPAATENEFDIETGTLYSEGADGNPRLYTIDQSTGGVLGSVVHPSGALNGLEVVGSTLYGTFINGPNRPSTLVTVDVSTGAFNTIGPTGLGPITGLAYDAAARVMYGSTSGASGPADLVTLDLATGAATVVGSMGIFRVGSIEFLAGTMYAATSQRSPTPGRLYTVNTSTGAATLVAPISGLDRPSITGLTTAPCHRPTDNPDDFGVFGGACYASVRGPEDGFQSEQACIDDFGGYLASIHSQAEDDFISALVDPGAAGGITAYIGGEAPGPSFRFVSGPLVTYLWSDGSPWDYENWRRTTGEPNGSGPAPAGVQFWPNTNGGLSGWNDVPKSAPLGGYVCKYAPRALPNQPPVADANGPYEGNEGSVITLDGSGSVDPDGIIVMYEWDLDDDGDYDDATGVTAEFTWDDNGSYTVGLMVTDDAGAIATDGAEVTVNNVAPTVDAGDDATVYSGETFSQDGSFEDPGSEDTHTATVDYGAGAGPESLALTDHSFTLAQTYFATGSYVVTVEVVDDDGGVGVDEVEVTVLRLPVDLDIKPGSEPNSVNLKSKGVIPVAILGSADFDVTTLDVTSLAFGPAGATPAHKSGGHLEDVNADGLMDLVSHYRTQETGLTPDALEACVLGTTTEGVEIEGCDAVRIVGG